MPAHLTRAMINHRPPSSSRRRPDYLAGTRRGQGAHPPSTPPSCARSCWDRCSAPCNSVQPSLHTPLPAHASGVPECLGKVGKCFIPGAGSRCLSVSLPQISLDGPDSFLFLPIPSFPPLHLYPPHFLFSRLCLVHLLISLLPPIPFSSHRHSLCILSTKQLILYLSPEP